MKVLLVLAGLVLCIVMLAGHIGTSDTHAVVSSSSPAPTDAPLLPIYLGVPMTNVFRRWGHEQHPMYGYLTCPPAPAFSAWHAFADTQTNRVNYIGPRATCFPGALPWREWVVSFLPPDAQLVDTVQEDGGTVAEHYVSGWLAQRMGSPDIMVRGDDDGNTWIAETGWQPFPASR